MRITGLSLTLIILGCAPQLIEDYKLAVELRPKHDVMALNMSAKYRADHIASLHPENMHIYAGMQEKIHDDFKTHSQSHDKYLYPIDHWYDLYDKASSAGFAIQIAPLIGYGETILCGCPLDDDHYIKFRKGMKRLKNYNVYSMSGYTRYLFGEPDARL